MKRFMGLLLGIFVFLRLPSLFEPYWYGDEGIYQVIGMGMRQGRLLYTEVWDNKPPLLFLVYGLFAGEQMPVRFLSLLFGLAAVIVFFFLSKRLLHTKQSIFLATFSFCILLATPILEGNIANTENFMLLPIVLGMLLLVSAQKIPYRFFFSGLLFSIAFLFKIVGIFDFAAAACFFLITKKFRQLIPLTTGFIIPIVLTAFYFYTQGRFVPFFQTVLTNNIGYVGYANQFIIPQGFLILKVVLLFSGLSILYFQRKKISRSSVFIYIWFLWSLFNAFFSGRNYTHYFLLLLPSACLLIGSLNDKNCRRKLHSYLLLFLLVL